MKNIKVSDISNLETIKDCEVMLEVKVTDFELGATKSGKSIIKMLIQDSTGVHGVYLFEGQCNKLLGVN